MRRNPLLKTLLYKLMPKPANSSWSTKNTNSSATPLLEAIKHWDEELEHLKKNNSTILQWQQVYDSLRNKQILVDGLVEYVLRDTSAELIYNSSFITVVVQVEGFGTINCHIQKRNAFERARGLKKGQKVQLQGTNLSGLKKGQKVPLQLSPQLSDVVFA